MSVESDMRLAEKVLKDAGYDSWFAAGPLPSNPNSTRAIIRVRVGAENTQIAATTRGNVTKYLVSTLRDDGKSQTKNFEFSDYREAITYFYRQAQALRGGLSVKTRAYPHHGEGDRLPLPNPAARPNPTTLSVIARDPVWARISLGHRDDEWVRQAWAFEKNPAVLRDILRLTGDSMAADIIMSGNKACTGKTRNPKCCDLIRAASRVPTAREILDGSARKRERDKAGARSNPAKMRASDLQVFADLKLELEELGIKTTEGMDGASFHLGAYLTDARGKGERLTVFRYVFPSTRARDGNRTQRTHPYAVVRVPQPYSSKSSSGPREFRTFEEASEHMLRVARAWKLGRKEALRGRPEDPDYRAPLPGGRSR